MKEADKDILNWNHENLDNNDINIDNFFQQVNTINKKIINQQIVSAYKLIGEVLRAYTIWKLTKAFNILSKTEDRKI